MPAFDRVDAGEVFKQGVLIARRNETVYFHVPEVSSNPISFVLEIRNGDVLIEYDNDDPYNYKVRVYTPFHSQGMLGSYFVIFSEDKSLEYSLNFIVTMIGDEHDYMISLNYNFVRKPR